jgi:hypothetical protein
MGLNAVRRPSASASSQRAVASAIMAIERDPAEHEKIVCDVGVVRASQAAIPPRVRRASLELAEAPDLIVKPWRALHR